MILIRCPLCGSEVDPMEEMCKSCPMGKKCEKVCCPNCKYEFIPQNMNMIKFFRNIRREQNEQ